MLVKLEVRQWERMYPVGARLSQGFNLVLVIRMRSAMFLIDSIVC
jgi:hypothetical protein